MSRSRRKSPIAALVGGRDKPARQQGNRRFRQRTRRRIRRYDPDADVLPALLEISSVYDWPSDGSRMWIAPDDYENVRRLLKK